MTPRLKLKGFPTPPVLLAAVILLMAALGSFSCGNSSDENLTDTSDILKNKHAAQQSHRPPGMEEGGTPAQNAGLEEGSEPGTENEKLIRKALILPDKIYTDSIIEVRAELAAPLKENQRLAYIFFKNNESMEESGENTLPTRTCKKRDILFADVLVYQNDELIAKKRTPMAPVLNTLPDIQEITFPEVKGPGVYQFLVKAKDTDDDPLTFSLETPADAMPLDAQIDPATGTVSCSLDQGVGDSISFTIVADDGDGGVTKKIVTMRFFIRPEKKG